jgi:hypothetical protein
VVSAPLGVTLKTVPKASPEPPNSVVPYRFPSVAWISPGTGPSPSVQGGPPLQKLYSEVSVPLVVISKMLP